MTHSIAVSPDLYKQLCQYSQRMGKTVHEAIYEAVEDWISMPEAEKRQILGKSVRQRTHGVQ
jgi:hypothetical protein